MADNAPYPDDISALWGPQPEGVLTPAPPATREEPAPARRNGNGADAAGGNGAGTRVPAGEAGPRPDVARLAQAIAASHHDVVRLSAALDAHHRAAGERSEALRTEIDALCRRFLEPVDGLAAFQRELRHQVGQLGDILTAHGQDSVLQAAARDRHDATLRTVAERLAALSDAVAAVGADVATLREEVAGLRVAVDGVAANGRRIRWRGRSG